MNVELKKWLDENYIDWDIDNRFKLIETVWLASEQNTIDKVLTILNRTTKR